MNINYSIFSNYYILINIVIINYLSVRCIGTKSSSSESDIDPEHEIEIPLSDEKPTKRTRTTTVSTTKDPRFEVVPKVMVFDLDYVIWPYNVAVDIKPPFALNRYVPSTTIKPKRGQKIDPILGYDRNREVIDHNGKLIKIYDGVADLLGQLKRSGTKIAVVSQTPEIGTVHHLLKMFDIDRFIDYVEVSMESNTVHIQRIKEKAGCTYEDMLFYSANHTLVDEIVKLKIMSMVVPEKKGLKSGVLFTGINYYEAQNVSLGSADISYSDSDSEFPDATISD